MLRSDVLVFTGLTIAEDEVQEMIPGAVCLPPVHQGDIDMVINESSDKVIAIIDGSLTADFSQEILRALKQGMKVYGAAGLGAFLAAQFVEQGMVGVGEIYRAYCEKIYLDKAELNDSMDVEPMVNIRATMEHAVEGNALGREMADKIIKAAQSLDVTERSFAKIFLHAEKLGIDKNILSHFAEWVESGGHVDQKKIDAYLLLDRIRYDIRQKAYLADEFYGEGLSYIS